MVDQSTFQAIVASGVAGGANTSVLFWLVRVVLRQQRKLDRTEMHVRYIRRDVAYLNGRAEPADNGEAEPEE